MPRQIKLASSIEQELRRHCEAAYPHEACGALFGQGDGSIVAWQVTAISAAPNEHGDGRKRRYLIPPDFQLQAERHAEATGQEVLGYYHSHPDHPARPSEYDRAHAWFGYLYLICAVQQGRAADLNAVALDVQGAVFLDVDVEDPAEKMR